MPQVDMHFKSEVELLAPAGNMQALHAAVCAGADAIYVGLDRFNARRGAENFSLSQFEKALCYAHLRGVKVYVALNIIILPHEIEEALCLAEEAFALGADAFIVQDLGLACAMKERFPQARLHFSTQMNIHNVHGIAAAHDLGASRVTLARELSLPEIELVSKEARSCGLQIECFAHGALCMCYSGQCFLSSMIGRRSANRGMCAQACRLAYELFDEDGGRIIESTGPHLLSPRDLCAIDLLPHMIAAGVSSFKIEGRMKSADYVYTVVKTYRKALDRILKNQTAKRRNTGPAFDKSPLEEAFSRGFTTAYLEGRRGNDIMSYTRPNNRGVRVGRVAKAEKEQLYISVQKNMHVGDILEVWTNRGRFALEIKTLDFDESGFLKLPCAEFCKKGDRVFRVRNAALEFRDSDKEPRITVDASLHARLGKPLRMELSTASDNNCRSVPEHIQVSVKAEIMEAARTKALTREDIRKHIDRFGETPFVLRNLRIELDEGLGLGFSSLHHLRARAAEALQAALIESYRLHHAKDTSDEKENSQKAEKAREAFPLTQSFELEEPFSKAGGKREVAFFAHSHRKKQGLALFALVTNPQSAKIARECGFDGLYIPALNLATSACVSAGRLCEASWEAIPKDASLVLPAIVHEAVLPAREASCGFDAWRYADRFCRVVAESIGEFYRACCDGFAVEVGPHLPVVNAQSAEFCAKWGASRIWLSPELNLSQIRALCSSSGLDFGYTIAGRQELMYCEHCILMCEGPCAQNCVECGRRKTAYALRDRLNLRFPVLSDVCGRSHLYNSFELDVLFALPDLVDAGVRSFMVDTTWMDLEQCKQVFLRAKEALDRLHKGFVSAKVPHTTAGHLFRGVS